MSFQRSFTGRVFIGVSLDGFIARPDGDLDWLTERGAAAEGDLGYQEFADGVDTVVMGRATYEKALSFGSDVWPYAGKHVAVLSTRLPAGADPRVTVHRSLEDLLVTALTESYAADGAAPTLSQAILLIQQALTEFAITGSTLTVKKLDGTTTAAVMTLDSSTAPTSTTRTG